MTDDRALTPGTYTVDAPCPDRGGIETLLARLSPVRTSGTDDETTLRLKARSRSVDHVCGRLRLFDGVTVTTTRASLGEAQHASHDLDGHDA